VLIAAAARGILWSGRDPFNAVRSGREWSDDLIRIVRRCIVVDAVMLFMKNLGRSEEVGRGWSYV
jgi:hypothetical protein